VSALSAKALEPADLGGQVVDVDVDMHAGVSLARTLYEQPESWPCSAAP
jgi:hypothetical protein